MYKCYQNNIASGREQFPLSWIAAENLLYLTMWILAGYLLWPIFNPILTILWAVIVLVIQIMLKKHNCSGCYYYNKLCHLGWGKISSALFKQDSGDPEIGIKLSLFYIVSPPIILIISIIYEFLTSFTLSYGIAICIYVLLNVISFPIRKAGCGQCVMKKVCPGSADKG